MTDINLGRRIATGATWMVMQRIAVRGIGLVSTIILARLLLPADFGIVALATGIVAVLDSLLELGFDLALIQNQTSERRHYDAAWSLTIIRGVLTAVVLLAGAQPMASLYGDERLVQVMVWLAASSVVVGFQNIGTVDFRKDLQFDKEFRLLVWSKVAGFVVTVGLAWYWRDYRALVAGIVVGRLVTVLASYVMHPYRPRFSLRGSAAFLHFSKWLCLNNVVIIIRTRLDTFVIGKLAGADILGLYNVGYEISNLTSSELIWPISRVLFPGFAKISGDRGRLARGFLDSLAIIIFLAAPMAVGIGLTAEHIVALFLGARWMSIVPLIQVLTIYGLLNLTSANSGALYMALGRPDLIVGRNLPSMIVLIPALIAGVKFYGALGAAWALILAAVVNFVFNFLLMRRELGVGMGETLRAVWRPLYAAIIMLMAVGLIEHLWPVESAVLGLIPQLAVLVFTGAAVYFVAVVGLWHLAGRPAGAEQRALGLLVSFLEARAARAKRMSSSTLEA